MARFIEKEGKDSLQVNSVLFPKFANEPRRRYDGAHTHFVGGVPIGRHTVRTDDDGRHVSLGHEGGSHAVADEGGRDCVVYQLKCGQPRTLVVRPCLSAVCPAQQTLFV